MRVCVYMLHAYLHACKHTFIYRQTCIHIDMHTRNIKDGLHITSCLLNVGMHTCVYAYTCVCGCLCACVGSAGVYLALTVAILVISQVVAAHYQFVLRGYFFYIALVPWTAQDKHAAAILQVCVWMGVGRCGWLLCGRGCRCVCVGVGVRYQHAPMYMRIRAILHTSIHKHGFMHIHKHSMHTCNVCVSVCLCVCVSVCLYVFTFV